jgi:DNA polymerase-3 subunit delta'
VQSGSHPDVTVLRSDKSIGVDAIRELLHAVSEHTYEGGKRIVRIENAERMTPQAQNSLLKTLEEPNEETVFLLTCDDTTKLLPTIISRCRILRLHPWTDAYITNALQNRGISQERAKLSARVSGGSIGAALLCAENGVFAFERRNGTDTICVCVNRSSQVYTISGNWHDLLSDTDYSGNVRIAPDSAVILKKR